VLYVRSLLTFERNVLPHLQDRSIDKPTRKNLVQFRPGYVTSFSALKKEEYFSPKLRRLTRLNIPEDRLVDNDVDETGPMSQETC
jgi:hypothetical protein